MWIYCQILYKTLNSFSKSAVLTLTEYWALHNHLFPDMFKTYLGTLLLEEGNVGFSISFLMSFSSLKAQLTELQL